VSLDAVDENGLSVSGVTITPKTVSITQPISLLGGFKNVVVKVVTYGQVANGYRLTNISVVPPNVTIFSSSQSIIEELPGYVETVPVDLTGLTDNVDRRVDLSLHPQVAMVGEQSVLVQIGVAAIESSMTVSLPVEALGMSPDLQAHISPATVDVIVSGPLPVLDKLTPASFRIVVNLADLSPGSYPLTPVVDLKPDQVQVQAILPESVEVNITLAPTVTPTFPFSIQPSPNPTATPGPKSTPVP
jgi:YbbR domain-containing protein